VAECRSRPSRRCLPARGRRAQLDAGRTHDQVAGQPIDLAVRSDSFDLPEIASRSIPVTSGWTGQRGEDVMSEYRSAPDVPPALIV
jgi:hypothetical protein